MSRDYTEDTLVQQTTAEYFQRQLGWESVYAYKHLRKALATFAGARMSTATCTGCTPHCPRRTMKWGRLRSGRST